MFPSLNIVSFSVEDWSKSDTNLDQFAVILENKESIEQEIAERFAAIIKEKATEELWDTKDVYINSIHINKGEVTLDTSNPLVDMVENGKAPYDMKPGFLNSPKVKVNAKGQRYLVVPLDKFKHGRYNWRDRATNKFTKSTTPGPVEFRTVSDNSEASSWQHPGYDGIKLFQETLDTFDEIADQIIDDRIDQLLNEL